MSCKVLVGEWNHSYWSKHTFMQFLRQSDYHHDAEIFFERDEADVVDGKKLVVESSYKLLQGVCTY
jgi:hypothetical protein